MQASYTFTTKEMIYTTVQFFRTMQVHFTIFRDKHQFHVFMTTCGNPGKLPSCGVK